MRMTVTKLRCIAVSIRPALSERAVSVLLLQAKSLIFGAQVAGPAPVTMLWLCGGCRISRPPGDYAR